jgi:ATP-dependent DNA helicase RecQ
LIGQAVLEQRGDEYPVLKLNPASWEVMRGQRNVRLIRLVGQPQAAEQGALPVGADAELFETLRQLRRQEAIRASLQPYQVFPDTVLAEMARGRPTTEEAMRRISGVGDYRLQAFGRVFLDAIIAHCQRTGLATDVPLPRSTGSKLAAGSVKMSPRKELAFRLFREGAAIADVAHQLGVTTGTISEHLSDFIQMEKPESIFAWVPEDVCERVAAAAEIHGTGRLKPVFLELNEQISYEHIRVVFAFLNATK